MNLHNLFLIPNFQIFSSLLMTDYNFEVTFTEVGFKQTMIRKDHNPMIIWGQAYRITKTSGYHGKQVTVTIESNWWGLKILQNHIRKQLYFTDVSVFSHRLLLCQPF